MSPYLDDGDVKLYHGDALEQLALMPSESVQCIITSPPFWGLRDYGIDGQIGLEETPDEWCAKLVAVMREARRVLRSDGVCWIEVGDTYASTTVGRSMHGTASATLNNGRDDFLVRESTRRSGEHRDLPDGVKAKDLVGAPWLLAFALRADGWYLRSDTIWSRPNPMPESVTDRPTKSHSYLFLLTKSSRYFFDADAIREDHHPDGRKVTRHPGPGEFSEQARSNGDRWPGTGRNARSVQTWPTQPTPFAHFATFPEALVSWCIRAGTSEHGACSECGAPWRRITEHVAGDAEAHERPKVAGHVEGGKTTSTLSLSGNGSKEWAERGGKRTTSGWEPSCRCCVAVAEWIVKPCVVLDPFMGSGTTALVARRLNRHATGIELNAEYLAIAATRLQQPTLWSTLV